MDLALDVAGGAKTCASCVHWHKLPTNLQNIREIKGECREGPPSLTLLPAANGQMMQLCGYPPTGPDFPACGRHSVKLDLVLSERANA